VNGSFLATHAKGHVFSIISFGRGSASAAFALASRPSQALLNPRFTVQGFLSLGALFSDNTNFTQQIARLAEGLSKAGLPEK
jgi:hypothetical protein